MVSAVKGQWSAVRMTVGTPVTSGALRSGDHGLGMHGQLQWAVSPRARGVVQLVEIRHLLWRETVAEVLTDASQDETGDFLGMCCRCVDHARPTRPRNRVPTAAAVSNRSGLQPPATVAGLATGVDRDGWSPASVAVRSRPVVGAHSR